MDPEVEAKIVISVSEYRRFKENTEKLKAVHKKATKSKETVRKNGSGEINDAADELNDMSGSGYVLMNSADKVLIPEDVSPVYKTVLSDPQPTTFGFSHFVLTKKDILKDVPDEYKSLIKSFLNHLTSKDKINVDSNGQFILNGQDTDVYLKDVCPFLYYPELKPPANYAEIIRQLKSVFKQSQKVDNKALEYQGYGQQKSSKNTVAGKVTKVRAAVTTAANSKIKQKKIEAAIDKKKKVAEWFHILKYVDDKVIQECEKINKKKR